MPSFVKKKTPFLCLYICISKKNGVESYITLLATINWGGVEDGGNRIEKVLNGKKRGLLTCAFMLIFLFFD